MIFYFAAKRTKVALVASVLILTIQGLLSYQGFYQDTSSTPPRFIFILLPTLLIILFTFFTQKGRDWMKSLDINLLIILSIIRIPVELILYSLFIHGAIPELMTFEGRNFDILAGITAPFVYYFIVVKKWNKNLLFYWNIIGLLLILNIIIAAILSAPAPFQQFAFDQPNIGILNFPFTLLGAYVAPVVLFSHLIMIYRKGE